MRFSLEKKKLWHDALYRANTMCNIDRFLTHFPKLHHHLIDPIDYMMGRKWGMLAMTMLRIA